MNRYFRRYFQSDEGGGGADPDEPISFGEAFGINPDGSVWEAPEPTPEPDPTPDPTPTPAEPAGDEPGATPPAAPAAPAPETTDQAIERLYAGKYKTVEELERGYDEARKKLSERVAPPEPEPTPVEKPRPLFKGDITEIKNEAQLYEFATNDPEGAAMFAMENHEALSEEQFNTVMNAWIAQQPFKAIQSMHAWQAELMREEFAERGRVQEEAYINDMRDKAIDDAVRQQPLLAHHADDLGTFISQHPQLTQMVEGARTVSELSSAIQAIFFMMAGPQLSQQALEAQVAARVNAETAAAAAAAAAEATNGATSINRNTAPPPDGSEDYTKMMQDLVLNPGKNR